MCGILALVYDCAVWYRMRTLAQHRMMDPIVAYDVVHVVLHVIAALCDIISRDELRC